MYVHPNSIVYHYRDKAFSGKPSYMLGKFIHISGNRLLVYYNNLSATQFIKKLPYLLMGIPFKVARIDDQKEINILRPVIALMGVPFILIYFLLRVLSNIEAGKEKADTAESVKTDRKPFKTHIQASMLFLFCAIALIFLYDQDWHGIYSAVHLFDWRSIPLLIGLTVLTHFITTVRTQLVFSRLGYRTRFIELFAISSASNFSMLMTPGGVGKFLSVPFLKSRFQIPLGFATLFVLVDRLFGFYFMTCFTLFGVLGYMTNQNVVFVIGVPLLLFLAWLFFYVLHIYDRGIHRFGVPEYGGKMMDHLGTDPVSQLAISFSKFIYFVIIIAQFIIIARGFDYAMGISNAWMIISVSFFAGILSLIPMGLVSRDASILALSASTGVPVSIGLIIILLMRAVTSIPTAILGIFCGLWLGKKHFHNKNIK